MLKLMEGGEYSINELNRKLHCRKDNLILAVKNLKKNRFVILRQEGNKKLVSRNTDFEKKMLVDLFYYVRKIEQSIEKKIYHLQELKKSGVTVEYLNVNKAYVLNIKTKEPLDEIIYLLKSLNNLSSSYSYLNDFESIHSESAILEIQKRCVKTTKKTIKNLIKQHHKWLLQNYIYLNIFRTDELQKLENYFKLQK